MGKGNLFGNHTWTLYGSDVDKRIRFIHTHNVRTLANIKAKNSLFGLAFPIIYFHVRIIDTRLKRGKIEMDSLIRRAKQYRGKQAVREFLAETMGTFILMVTFYTLLYITVVIIA